MVLWSSSGARDELVQGGRLVNRGESASVPFAHVRVHLYRPGMGWVAICTLGFGLALMVAGPGVDTQAYPDEARRATCIAEGGVPHSYGHGGKRWFCDQPFADAGKVCSAKSDCIGECTLPEDYFLVAGQKPRTVGTCQARVRVGCMTALRNGLPTQYCID